MRRAQQQQDTPHREGAYAPTQHASPSGGPVTAKARPTMRWDMYHHAGGHAPTQQAPP